MAEISEFCPKINETVDVSYHSIKTPILGKGLQDGGKYIDECSHAERCNVRTNDCPIFKKLNNI